MANRTKASTKSKRQSQKSDPIPLHTMRFCRQVKDKKDPNYPMDFWAIKCTGDCVFDYALGTQLANEYLNHVVRREDPEGPANSLMWIVNSMVQHGEEHAKGVRTGFLNAITRHLIQTTRI